MQPIKIRIKLPHANIPAPQPPAETNVKAVAAPILKRSHEEDSGPKSKKLQFSGLNHIKNIPHRLDLECKESPTELIFENPENEQEAYADKGREHLQNGDLEKALADFQESLKFGENTEALKGIGEYCFKMEYWNIAVKQFERVYALEKTVENGNNLIAVYVRYAQSLFTQGNNKIALWCAEMISEIDSDSKSAYSIKSSVYTRTGELGNAIDALRHLYEKDMSDDEVGDSLANALNKRASDLYVEGKKEEALADCYESISLNESSMAHAIRGAIYLEDGEFALAEEDLKRAFELDRKDGFAKGQLLEFYLKKGKKEAAEGNHILAIANYREYLKINGSNLYISAKISALQRNFI